MEKIMNVPVPYYAIQEQSNTGEWEPRSTEKQLPHGIKYETAENQGQGRTDHDSAVPLTKSGNNGGLQPLMENGNAASDENKTNTPADVQVEEPENWMEKQHFIIRILFRTVRKAIRTILEKEGKHCMKKKKKNECCPFAGMCCLLFLFLRVFLQASHRNI